MSGKSVFLFLFISIVVLGASRIQSTEAPLRAVQDGNVEFVQPSYAPGETATFLLKDSSLNTVPACSAKWVNIIAPVSINVFWNLVTGAPQPSAYDGLDDNCLFDIDDPLKTPIGSIQVKIDGLVATVSDIRPSTAEFAINTDFRDSGKNMDATFEHDIVDSYTASDERVRITSTSDPSGEWSGFTEVDEGNNNIPAPATALFKGGVFLDSDPNAIAPGDGAIFVNTGDSITVEYMDESGTVVLSSDQRAVSEPVPTPTPIPSANLIALLVLAGSFIVVLIWRLNKGVKIVR